jgi:quinol monooxygenase YgiN
MVATTAGEAGVLAYQRFIDEADKIIHLYERYENSDAALGHLQVFRDNFAERFAGMVSRARFTVYGTPTAELKKVLDGFDAIYLTTFGDLNYWP